MCIDTVLIYRGLINDAKGQGCEPHKIGQIFSMMIDRTLRLTWCSLGF